MNVVELTNEVLQVLGRKLLDNVVLDQLHQNLWRLHILNLLKTWQLEGLTLLLLAFLLLTLFLALLLLSAGSKELHVLELNHDHLIDVFLELVLQNGHHLLLGHPDVVLLVVVVSLVPVGPVFYVLFLLLIKLLNELGGSDLDYLILATSFALAFLALLSFLLLLALLLLAFLATSVVLIAIIAVLTVGRCRSREPIVEFFDICGRLTRDLLLLSDPQVPLSFHLLHDVDALVLLDFFLDLHPVVVILLLMTLLHGFTILLGLFHLFEGIVHYLSRGLLLTSHPEEFHLFLTQAVDVFARENTTDATLDECA